MPNTTAPEQFQALFEHAPISLWEEDYSGIRHLFEGLRARGVRSLEAYLQENPAFGDECIRQMTVRQVNAQTLSMLQARSQAELVAHLDRVFGDGMRHHFRSELLALWNGALSWSGEGVNYSLNGDPIDIILHWRILPGSEADWQRVLVSLEDITARKNAERRLQSLFDASPISLWEEDYGAVRDYFDTLRGQGVTDLESYLQENPQAVGDCMARIRVLDVNRKTLELFGAQSKEQLIAHTAQIFRDEMSVHFGRELVDLWNGKLAYEREGINYSLSGEAVNIHLDFRVMPGHETDFRWVLVAIQDITARKKAEDYLRYLGTHDVLTGLYNRAFLHETLHRLEKGARGALSVVAADLNGLKSVNDSLGHQAGDDLIRRAAEVLKAAFDDDVTVARVGGDEFIALLPGLQAEGAEETLERVGALVEMNNKYYREPELSIALGAATGQTEGPLEKLLSQADAAMYQRKGQYYRRRREDRK